MPTHVPSDRPTNVALRPASPVRPMLPSRNDAFGPLHVDDATANSAAPETGANFAAAPSMAVASAVAPRGVTSVRQPLLAADSATLRLSAPSTTTSRLHAERFVPPIRGERQNTALPALAQRNAQSLLASARLPQGWPVLPNGPSVPAREVWQVLEMLGPSSLAQRRARRTAAQTYVQVVQSPPPSTMTAFDPDTFMVSVGHAHRLSWLEGMPQSGDDLWGERHELQWPVSAARLYARPLVLERPQELAERVAVRQALSDVPAWYRALPPERAISALDKHVQQLRCVISLQPFADIEWPIAVYSTHVLHVFEAYEILAWMQHSLHTEPRRTCATSPLDRTPLSLQMLRALRRPKAPHST